MLVIKNLRSCTFTLRSYTTTSIPRSKATILTLTFKLPILSTTIIRAISLLKPLILKVETKNKRAV